MPYKKRTQAKRRNRAPKLNLKARVLKIVNKQRENKLAIFESANQQVTAGMQGHTHLQRLFPDIAQGTDSDQRIGNTITMTKFVIRGYYEVIIPVTAYADQRIQLRQLINSQKGSKCARAIIDGDNEYHSNNLLEPSKPYIGTPNEYMTPVNRDAFSPRRDRRWTLKTGIQASDPTNNNVAGTKTFVYFTHTLTFGKGKKLYFKTGG